MAEASEYEVRCARCNVSFPVGTKTCLHCGGPTAHGLPSTSMRRREREPAPFEPWAAAGEGAQGASVLRPLPVDAEDEDAVPTARGRVLRAGVTVMWILLAIGFSAVRACSEK